MSAQSAAQVHLVLANDRIHRPTCKRIPANRNTDPSTVEIASAKPAACCKPREAQAIIDAAIAALEAEVTENNTQQVAVEAIDSLTARQRVFRLEGGKGWGIMGTEIGFTQEAITHKRVALRLSASIKRAETAARKARGL